MRLLGIDYGSKRVGIAVADSDLRIAFPKAVVPNTADLFDSVAEIVKAENATRLILGESKDLKGKDNAIAEDIKLFKEKLEQKLNIEIIYEPEFYTSIQAARLQGEGGMIDASAAAIILQSYLDKANNK